MEFEVCCKSHWRQLFLGELIPRVMFHEGFDLFWGDTEDIELLICESWTLLR